jgi:hypothetical protein
VHPYFVVVVRPAWSDDPDSNAGCSLATDAVSDVRDVEVHDPEKKDILVLQFGGWSLRLTNLPP